MAGGDEPTQSPGPGERAGSGGGSLPGYGQHCAGGRSSSAVRCAVEGCSVLFSCKTKRNVPMDAAAIPSPVPRWAARSVERSSAEAGSLAGNDMWRFHQKTA